MNTTADQTSTMETTIDHGAASARLRSLQEVVSADYAAAIAYALELIAQGPRVVERVRVISMLTQRAESTDYLVLRAVLLEMAAAVGHL